MVVLRGYEASAALSKPGTIGFIFKSPFKLRCDAELLVSDTSQCASRVPSDRQAQNGAILEKAGAAGLCKYGKPGAPSEARCRLSSPEMLWFKLSEVICQCDNVRFLLRRPSFWGPFTA